MRGWSNYFKHAVAKHTMSSLENFVWHRVIRWWKKLHRWRWKFTETPKTTNSPPTPHWPQRRLDATLGG